MTLKLLKESNMFKFYVYPNGDVYSSEDYTPEDLIMNGNSDDYEVIIADSEEQALHIYNNNN